MRILGFDLLSKERYNSWANIEVLKLVIESRKGRKYEVLYSTNSVDVLDCARKRYIVDEDEDYSSLKSVLMDIKGWDDFWMDGKNKHLTA